jgi:hypothetical protein
MCLDRRDGERLPPVNQRARHHATVIQSLPKTIGLADERLIVLDQLRKKRNLSDYVGEGISEEEAAACVRAADDLVLTVEQWLRANRLDLIG